MLVDWNTISIYTCSDPKCMPGKDSDYIEEYAFIQFSDDFSRVQYADDKEIQRQKQKQAEQERE